MGLLLEGHPLFLDGWDSLEMVQRYARSAIFHESLRFIQGAAGVRGCSQSSFLAS